MDIELARTFLAIVAAGSFVRAAERLHVSQTTVSARVRTLEDHLRRPVFVRSKAGAALTPAGEEFLRHAPALVQLWERARHQVAVPEGKRAVLAIGCELVLRDALLLRWVLWLRRAMPDVALRAHAEPPGILLEQVANGIVDIGVVYAPRYRPGLRVELLAEDRLVMVRTRPGRDGDGTDHVRVDWGPELNPAPADAALFVTLGPLGLDYIVEAGGSGYFRRSAVQPHLRSGRLELVPDMPDFPYPAYAVFSEAAGDPALLAQALAGLREIAQLLGEGAPASAEARPSRRKTAVKPQ